MNDKLTMNEGVIQMLKKYIEQYYKDSGLDNLAVKGAREEGDRFSLMLGLENGSSEVVIIDSNIMLNQWTIMLIFENERNKSRRWLLKLLEWNYNESEHLPGFFTYDNSSNAITLKKRLSSDGLSYQHFRSVLQNLLAHASFRREQLLRISDNVPSGNKRHSGHIKHMEIQKTLSMNLPSKYN